MTTVTIRWPGNIARARAMSHNVLDHYGLPRGLTVNGLTTLDVDAETLEGLRKLRDEGFLGLTREE